MSGPARRRAARRFGCARVPACGYNLINDHPLRIPLERPPARSRRAPPARGTRAPHSVWARHRRGPPRPPPMVHFIVRGSTSASPGQTPADDDQEKDQHFPNVAYGRDTLAPRGARPRRAERRLPGRDERDGDDEKAGLHEVGDHAGQEELPDGLLGHDPVDDGDHRARRAGVPQSRGVQCLP
jgi:hypothetical protein